MIHRTFQPLHQFSNPQIRRVMQGKFSSPEEKALHQDFTEVQFYLRIFGFPNILQTGEEFSFKLSEIYVSRLLNLANDYRDTGQRAFLIWMGFRFLGNILQYKNLFEQKRFQRDISITIENLALEGLYVGHLIDPDGVILSPLLLEHEMSLFDLFEKFPLPS